MSQQMNFRDGNGEASPSYSSRYEETPDYNSYATGFGLYRAGQKLFEPPSADKTPTASQRLALAIVSLALWVITLFGTVILAIASRADSSAAIFILLGVTLFAALIAVVNIVFNRKT
jgi:hypothetical protein